MTDSGESQPKGGTSLLTSILPGLRDLRTPLACGYLWLAVLWSCVAGSLPERGEVDGLIGKSADLISSLPTAAALGIVTFAAYVLGSGLSFTRNYPLRTLQGPLSRVSPVHHSRSKWLIESRVRDLYFERTSETGMTAETIGAHLDLWEGEHPDITHYSEDVIERVTDICYRQRKLTAHALVAENTEYFNRYDRKSAEAEFRISISFPLFLLSIATSTAIGVQNTLSGLQLTLLILGCLAVCFIAVGLALVGLQLESQAQEILIQTIHIGKVTPPILQALSEVRAPNVYTSSEAADRTATQTDPPSSS